MNADDLTRPLKPTPRRQRRGIVLPIAAGTLCGALSGFAILFATPDRGKPLSPASVPQPALADAAVTAPAQATPTAKTITVTVIDSQTGAKREVILPAPTNYQPEGDLSLRSTATITPAGKAGARGAAKSKRHSDRLPGSSSK
jgi:hypothetical protein